MEINIFNAYKILITRYKTGKSKNSNKRFISDKCLPVARTLTKNPFFIHIHLPKTGGTTFNTILEKNFKEKYEPFVGRLIHHLPYINNEQIEGYVKKHPGMKCLTSHIFRATLPYQSSVRSIIAVAFVRNPIDRFFSFYFHMRHRYGVDCLEKKLDLEDYINHVIEQNNKEKFEGYLQHFCGIENEESYNYIEKLVENGHLYIFSTYKMKESLELLKNNFPNDFKVISFKQENISIKDQVVTDEMRKKVGNYVSDYDWRLLEIAEKIIS